MHKAYWGCFRYNSEGQSRVRRHSCTKYCDAKNSQLLSFKTNFSWICHQGIMSKQVLWALHGALQKMAILLEFHFNFWYLETCWNPSLSLYYLARNVLLSSVCLVLFQSVCYCRNTERLYYPVHWSRGCAALLLWCSSFLFRVSNDTEPFWSPVWFGIPVSLSNCTLDNGIKLVITLTFPCFIFWWIQRNI